ncbi:hypothetical protein, partial [Pseudoalteromonas fuliginea]
NQIGIYTGVNETTQAPESYPIISGSSKFRFGYEKKLNRIQTLDVEAYQGTSMLGPRGNIIGGSVYDAVEWSKTGRGGKVYDLVTEALTQDVCSSKYGLCE